MDELDEARTDLCQLEETERTLLKQLVEIRAAIKAQEDKIEELIKKQPPAINRLPVELLSKIIFQSLPTFDDVDGCLEFSELASRRTNLSTVSRLWRNVILTTPEIWGDIVCCHPLPVASLKTQLIRSGNIPLSVFILNFPSLYLCQLDPQWLDVLVSSTSRWRRLHMRQMTPEILHAFEDLKFPSLEDVLIASMDKAFTYPQFLFPDNAPALRNLQLDGFLPTPIFTAATSLTTLALKFRERSDQHQIVNPTFIPTHSITMLWLTGYTDDWALSPDSIHLPHLEEFKLAVNNPKPVMRAIVTPKLMGFDYHQILGFGHVDFGTGSKFSHVQRVTLRLGGASLGSDALCQEFHGVQHVDLHVDTIYALFASGAQLGSSKWAPADHWTNLESLTIHGLCGYHHSFDVLVQWLTKRLESGWPRLSVRLSGFSSDLGTGMVFHDIYNKLRTCSNLRVVDVEMKSSARCSTSDGLLRLDLFGLEPLVSLADDMFLDCRVPGKCSMKSYVSYLH
ncbi:hypothetical protein BKA82DRAFT_4052262 [Pisolithus tinctorius]|nr:hypothetical protein BKA82DRAFT_4052262 [Pisolithus tinctorius]